MTDLKCTVKNCVYNSDNLCSKGDIMVSGKQASCDKETSCDSFMLRKEGMSGAKNSISHPSSSISIDCEAAKCTYNSNYRCHAEHVDIKGCDACDCKQTLCATFKEK